MVMVTLRIGEVISETIVKLITQRPSGVETFHPARAVLSKSMAERWREFDRLSKLKDLVSDIMNKTLDDLNCMVVLSDGFYQPLFTKELYSRFHEVPYFKIRVGDNEDLLAPNYKTLAVLKEARKSGCNTYIIVMANGDQLGRLLKFGDRHRVLDTRARYVFLFDFRLIQPGLHYIWKKIVNVIFLREYARSGRYEIITTPFPVPIQEVLVPRRLDYWHHRKFQVNADLFRDKTSNLMGQTLQVVTIQHVPASIRTIISPTDSTSSIAVKYSGLELEILRALQNAMNFRINVYEPPNSDIEKWGKKQLNGTYSGLLGEIEIGRADIGLGDLHYTPYHLKLIDLSIPYITQCLTFLTPEIETDNSWQTLILPFHLDMWIAILITILLGGFLFYTLATFHLYIEHKDFTKPPPTPKPKAPSKLSIAINKYIKRKYSDISEKLSNSINEMLKEKPSTEGKSQVDMLLVVSLPKMPTGWALRMLTGWWWLYCVLVVVAYRASLTAILANPAPRVTIDTLDQLAKSSLKCSGWGQQVKEFFLTSLDISGQKIGQRFEEVRDIETVVKQISNGNLAFYENIYYLKYISMKYSTKSNNDSRDTLINSTMQTSMSSLHIMSSCIINMPISLGLQKNSPLKPRVDTFMQRVIEAGLVKKWLNDVMLDITVTETEALSGNEEVKALMDLKKLYGGIVVLIVGSGLSILILLGELIHWYLVTKRSPHYDQYNVVKYYKTLRHY
uniref:Ionotropic receptor 11 n=1 Tax=Diaphorina citri TaxID=121845 RepID=A0A7T3R194_DIACI|nr:ionotropic receptor 11 [Diaphorina citri]